MRQAERTFDPVSESVSAARRFVSDVLSDWLMEALVWPAQQIISELATNAVLHAATPFTVVLILGDDAVRVEVRDSSSRAPRQRHFSDEATTGRGLALVSSLTRAWGVQQGAMGKSVWCELTAEEPRADVAVDLDAFLSADDVIGLDLDPRAADGAPGDVTTQLAA
ncbi:MAG TPA: ATP-binding protein [Mycobacteriales bacterium]|nr:ATP-binding protein [Mycobacteriales bacterium]